MCLLYAKQPTMSSHLYHFLYWAHTQGHYSSDLITLGPSTRQLGRALIPQSLLKLSKLANSRPVYPAWNILACSNHNKSSCPCSSLSPPPPLAHLTDPGASQYGHPPWCGMRSPLGNFEKQNIFLMATVF